MAQTPEKNLDRIRELRSVCSTRPLEVCVLVDKLERALQGIHERILREEREALDLSSCERSCLMLAESALVASAKQALAKQAP